MEGSQEEHCSCIVALGILRPSWELQLRLGGIDHCSCMLADRQQAGDTHSFAAKMGIRSCFHIQGEALLEHKDEGQQDGEAEEDLEQCRCFPESGSTVGCILWPL